MATEEQLLVAEFDVRIKKLEKAFLDTIRERNEARSERDAAMSLFAGWQLIQTAPKGVPLLLYLKKKIYDRNYEVDGLCDFVTIGYWIHDKWTSIEGKDYGSMGGEMTGWMEDWSGFEIDPSHWMLCPPPPKVHPTDSSQSIGK